LNSLHFKKISALLKGKGENGTKKKETDSMRGGSKNNNKPPLEFDADTGGYFLTLPKEKTCCVIPLFATPAPAPATSGLCGKWRNDCFL